MDIEVKAQQALADHVKLCRETTGTPLYGVILAGRAHALLMEHGEALVATHARNHRSLIISNDSLAVLRRLRDALPTVGINGWIAGVAALDEAIAAAAPR